MRIERILHSHEGAKELNLGTCSQLKEKTLHLFASFFIKARVSFKLPLLLVSLWLTVCSLHNGGCE